MLGKKKKWVKSTLNCRDGKIFDPCWTRVWNQLNVSRWREESSLGIIIKLKNQRGLWRRGLLQNTRPLALTKAAIPMLTPAQRREKSTLWKLNGPAGEQECWDRVRYSRKCNEDSNAANSSVEHYDDPSLVPKVSLIWCFSTVKAWVHYLVVGRQLQGRIRPKPVKEPWEMTETWDNENEKWNKRCPVI